MNSLLSFFIDLAWLRRKPQDLPISPVLLTLALLLSWLIGTAGSVTYYDGVQRALLANGLDILVISVLLRASLGVAGFPERFLQSATAIFGISGLFGALLLVIDVAASAFGLKIFAAFMSLILLVWVHLIIGFILQHALEKERWAGIVIAIGYTLIGVIVVSHFIPTVIQ